MAVRKFSHGHVPQICNCVNENCTELTGLSTEYGSQNCLPVQSVRKAGAGRAGRGQALNNLGAGSGQASTKCLWTKSKLTFHFLLILYKFIINHVIY